MTLQDIKVKCVTDAPTLACTDKTKTVYHLQHNFLGFGAIKVDKILRGIPLFTVFLSRVLAHEIPDMSRKHNSIDFLGLVPLITTHVEVCILDIRN